MKGTFPLHQSLKVRLGSVGLVVIAVVGAVVVLGLLGPPTTASDRPIAGPNGKDDPPSAALVNSSPASVPVSVAKAAHAEGGEGILATQPTTYTAFLPLIATNYAAPAPDSAFGIQVLTLDASIVEKLTEADAHWVRYYLSWRAVEPVDMEPEDFQWNRKLDEQLIVMASRNIKVILQLTNNPDWASTYPQGPIDLADVAEVGEFMAAAVAHYSAPPYNVTHFEFYNEPDNGNEYYCGRGWGCFGDHPEAYVDILRAVYAPMKAANPDAQIVFGGVAYDSWESTGGPFVETFVGDVLQTMQLEGGDYFDVMNFHYYPVFHWRWAPYGPGIIGKTAALQDKLASYGFVKPFVSTETSMWSDEVNGGSHELQARYIPQVFARTMVAGLDATIWFKLVDYQGLGVTKYGLLNPDLSYKPAFTAYQTLVQQLAPTDYVRTLDPAETGSDQIEAHEFVALNGWTRVIVVWSNDENSHSMFLDADHLVMVDRMGNETDLYDGDDGSLDGRVRVDVGGCSDGAVEHGVGRCPVYLHIPQ